MIGLMPFGWAKVDDSEELGWWCERALEARSQLEDMIPTRLEVDDEYRLEMRDMAYFLAKTDPGTYSLDDLKKDGTTEWDGVRNPTAVNFIKTMKPGDRVIIYHSQGESAVVGLAEAASDPRPDKNDAMSWVADFEPAPREEARDPERDQGVTSVRRLAARSPGSPSTMSAPAEFWKWLQKRGVF